jgi:hypothetical protein
LPPVQVIFFHTLMFSIAAGVVDTGGAPWLANISANFRNNSKWPLWDTVLRGWWEDDSWKNLEHKISWHCRYRCKIVFKMLQKSSHFWKLFCILCFLNPGSEWDPEFWGNWNPHLTVPLCMAFSVFLNLRFLAAVDGSAVCFSYAHHGHCPEGNSCPLSHNIDLILR